MRSMPLIGQLSIQSLTLGINTIFPIKFYFFRETVKPDNTVVSEIRFGEWRRSFRNEAGLTGIDPLAAPDHFPAPISPPLAIHMASG